MKIVLVGAGSLVFSRRLLGDLLLHPELRASHFYLMDIDAERLQLIESLARRMMEAAGGEGSIAASTDRRDALDGADVVVVLVQVGGLEAYYLDVDIPRRYGLDQCVGDTLGPGGVFRALRTIPAVLSICRDMERLCPDALLLNYANPMAMTCWALNRASSVRAVGLCHSVPATAAFLARIIGAPIEEVDYRVAGINHMAWFLRFEWRGQDAYPLLREVLSQRGQHPQDLVRDAYEGGWARFELMRHFGCFVTESSHHLSEYLPYFRRTPELVHRYLPDRWDYLHICQERLRSEQAQIAREARGEIPLVFGSSGEYAPDIIHSLATGQPRLIYGNVPNQDLITNLPRGCCVEVPCVVDLTGIHPCQVGELPPGCAALNRSNVSVQELAVEAALTGDRRLVKQAIMLDPLTSAVLTLDQIEAMVDEMFAEEQEFLAPD